ncbi:hypothetical protein [Streptomyces sp. GS7]|nr:hypothetical protein [Streptomyces sp. GS7]
MSRRETAYPQRSRHPMDDDLLNRLFARYHRRELVRRHRAAAAPNPV